MAQAKVDLPQLFADNMVLQQQSDVALWGKAEAGAKVTITTTWSKAKTVAKADADGDWFVRLATPAAGGPYEITFDDGDKLTLKNVLIGEVWICSGQSNMEMQMSGYDGQPVAGAAASRPVIQGSSDFISCLPLPGDRGRERERDAGSPLTSSSGL